jgi:C_GCAxxG_C_C family probable redox protein
MKPLSDSQRDTIEPVCQKVGRRAANLFLTRQLWCAPAVLVVMNQVLQGGLPVDLVIRLSAGLSEGLGGSGCLCGGVSGGVLAMGLLLGNGRPSASGDPIVLSAARHLRQAFKKRFGSTCCRALTKNLEKGSRRHYRLCADRTAYAAEGAARIILDHRPELIQKVDWDYLNQKENLLGAQLKIVARRWIDF